MIRITRSIAIDEDELNFTFVRSSGPGGQNVNKVATAAQLRFDAANSPNLPDDMKERLTRLAGKRMTNDGVLIVDARRYRSQERNRDDALDRFVALLRRAAVKPRPRKKTAPTRASRERRLASKRRRSQQKQQRRPPALEQ